MPHQTLNVCVISGPTLTGKSYLLQQLRSLPNFVSTPTVEMDKVRESVFGDRRLTDTEHRFKNELTRQLLKTKLITERPFLTFMEMGLPTADYHQKPLVETIRDANNYLNLIDSERSHSGHRVANWKIELRVILNYCDIETIKRRIVYRQSHKSTHINLKDYLRDMTLLFEIPHIYKPLPINTSDECSDARESRLSEVISFLHGNWPIDPQTWLKRMREFEDKLDEARGMYAEIKESNHTRRMPNFGKVKLLAVDCDGVLTNATTLVGTGTAGSGLQEIAGPNGIELSPFHHRDGTGIQVLIRSGIPVVMITSQISQYVVARGTKLWNIHGRDDKKFAYFNKVENKPQCLKDYLRNHHPEINLNEVCYIGDDLGDIEIMKIVGLPVAVNDAIPEIREIATYITEKEGGYGAVREVCDLIIKSRNAS